MVRKRFLLTIAISAIALLIPIWVIIARTGSPEVTHAEPLTEKMLIRMLVPAPADSRLPQQSEDVIRQTIEERFDVRIQLDYIALESEYNAEVEARLLANKPPDMWIERTSDLGSTLALYGVLADMTSYVSPTTMPNYFNNWISETEIKRYHVHNRFYRAPIPYDKNAYRSYYIRKDWLDHLGLNIPQNYDEYSSVLRAFTLKDPDQNQINDTYGFSVAGNSSSLSTDWPEYTKNGLVYPAFMDHNVLVDMESDLRVGQVIEDILKLVKEGVVDPDWFLNTEEELTEKAVTGKVGVVLGDTADFALDANPTSIQSLTRASNPDANWVPFNLFGNAPLQAKPSPGHPFVFSKQAADQHPAKVKKIVEILDWLSSEDGFLLTHYGLEGVNYTRSGNTITLIEPTSAQEQDMRWLHIWSFFTPETPSVLGLQVINPKLTERDKEILTFLAQLPTKPKLGVPLSPPIDVNLSAFRKKQNELLVKSVFSDHSGAKWPQYHDEIMNSYYGNEIIGHFEQQVRKANE